MERLDDLHREDVALAAEHEHRYKLAALFARGHVVDCACGTGYGSQLFNFDEVEEYLGFDPSSDAISVAQTRFSTQKAQFKAARLEQLPIESETVDTFICLETLEHLNAPKEGIKEIHRVLKQTGVLIGSVPTYEYEGLCAQVYGPNPFHLQRLKVDHLQEMLAKNFSHVKFGLATFCLCTVFTPHKNSTQHYFDISAPPFTSLDDGSGSLFFFATNSSEALRTLEMRACGVLQAGPSLPEMDRSRLVPLRETISKQTDLLNDWQITLDTLEARICALDETVGSQTRMIDERDSALRAQTVLIEERDAALAMQVKVVEERDKALRAQDSLLSEKSYLVESSTSAIAEREATIQSQSETIQSQFGTIQSQLETITNLNEKIRKQGLVIDEHEKTIHVNRMKLDAFETNWNSKSDLVRRVLSLLFRNTK